MATGLTHGVRKDEDGFERFVWRCATQSFYDCSTVPTVEEIEKQFRSDSYYHESLAREKAALDKLDSMTDAQIEEEERREIADDKKRFAEAEATKKIERDRYMQVRAQVEAWQPPAELEGLKLLCIRQIDESVEHDCADNDPKWYFRDPRPAKTARAERRKHLVDSIRRSEEEIARMKSRVEEKVKFVRELEKSIPRPKGA